MICGRLHCRPALAAIVLAGGCAATTTRPGPRPRFTTTPAGVSRTTHVQAAILALGSVPYDNLSLPIVSPDGEFVATQTGVMPTWPTVLAEPGAAVPQATRIQIYSLDRQLGHAALHATIDEPLLLGRACDAGGFLVESIRPDGARWIGYASWSSGAIDWLIADDRVNAFACLGSDGRLAWSRRAGDADHFDLVVRRGDQEWTIGAQGGDWLCPVWSGKGDGLFALRLEQEMLRATHMIATDPTAIHQSLKHVTLAMQADVHDAYQTLASSVFVADSAPPGREALVFFHPAQMGMAVWWPVSRGASVPVSLAPYSTAALAVEPGFALVATEEALIIQNLADLRDRRDLLAGTMVPRRVRTTQWPYILLQPGDGRMGLLAMRLLKSRRAGAG